MKNTSILFVALLFLVGCSNENRSPSPDETPNQKNTATDTETRDAFPVISRGERVTLSDHVVAGQHTVFKFTADW